MIRIEKECVLKNVGAISRPSVDRRVEIKEGSA